MRHYVAYFVEYPTGDLFMGYAMARAMGRISWDIPRDTYSDGVPHGPSWLFPMARPMVHPMEYLSDIMSHDVPYDESRGAPHGFCYDVMGCPLRKLSYGVCHSA